MKNFRAEKASDLLLAAWVVVVGVFYFGGYFLPSLGAQTEKGAALYAFVLLASALVLVLRFLRRSPPNV